MKKAQNRFSTKNLASRLTGDTSTPMPKTPDKLAAETTPMSPTPEKPTASTSPMSTTPGKIASEVNATVENIGARRLHTIIEKILDEISFTATDRSGEKIVIDKEYINKNLDTLVKDTDLSKFIL